MKEFSGKRGEVAGLRVTYAQEERRNVLVLKANGFNYRHHHGPAG